MLGVSYRWCDSGRWSDRWVYMVDVRSDDVGQPDGHVRMVYRWADGVGQSDGRFGGLTGGVAD